jgi:YggT family protein
MVGGGTSTRLTALRGQDAEELAMSVLGTLLGYALTVFVAVMVARMVLDLVAMVRRLPWRVIRARTLTYTVTEPVLTPVRKVLRPVRLGEVSIDLAFTAVFVLALILRSIAFSL